MVEQNIAAIDIGTNTILMVVACVKPNGDFTVIGDYHEIARLGEDLGKTGIIKKEAVLRSKLILKNYSEICKHCNVTKINIVGTSALRDAENSEEVLNEFKSVICSDFQIISGEDEAQMSYMGTVETLNPSTVIDIGGGSTEFITGYDGLITTTSSLQIGAVRLTERYIKNHPPTDEVVSIINEKIREELKSISIPSATSTLYAVAGTPTSLAFADLRMKDNDFERVHGYTLTIDKLNNLLCEFLENDTNYIINKMFIHPKRADVITTGTLILIEALKHLRHNHCIVSSKGLRFGLLKSMISKLEID